MADSELSLHKVLELFTLRAILVLLTLLVNQFTFPQLRFEGRTKLRGNKKI